MQNYSSHAKLIACIALCLGIGWLGGLFTEASVSTWYPTLNKPSTTPPNWLFPIVWSILYTLMGVSLWLVIEAPTPNKTAAYGVFALQLFLNFIWSVIFFFYQSPFFGMIDICILWLTILAMFIIFWQHSKLAAVLLIPYWLWVGYAFYLNTYIAMNN